MIALKRTISKEIEVVVRTLSETDSAQVQVLDLLSNNNVSASLDIDWYAWGLFQNNKLLAYCTIGGIDGTEHESIAKEMGANPACTLSDVYVHPYCRRMGFGSELIKVAIEYMASNSTIFCTIFNASLYEFYESIGFEELEDGILCYKCKSNGNGGRETNDR